MRSDLRTVLGAAAAVWLSSPLLAWDTPKNPDLRPSFGFESGGSLDRGASQDITAVHSAFNQSRNLTDQILYFQIDALFPVSNSFSLQAGSGLSVDKTDVNETPTVNGTSNDATFASGLLSGRYYLVDTSLTSQDLSGNPDRWPSLGLTLSGQDTVYREQIDISKGVQTPRLGSHAQTFTVAGDSRLPLSASWTLLASLSWSQNKTEVQRTAQANGSDSDLKLFGFGAGARYYFVGQNFIRKENGQNPDRWTSLSLTVNGSHSTNAQQVITLFANGKTDTRDVTQKGGSIDAELRLPVTNNLTLRFGLSGGSSEIDAPVTSLSAGTKTTTPYFGGFFGLRGYFL